MKSWALGHWPKINIYLSYKILMIELKKIDVETWTKFYLLNLRIVYAYQNAYNVKKNIQQNLWFGLVLKTQSRYGRGWISFAIDNIRTIGWQN